jgi:hypothetical protein
LPVWRWYFQRLNDGSDEPWAPPRHGAVAMSWPAQGFRLEARDPLFMIAAALTLFMQRQFHATAGSRDPGDGTAWLGQRDRFTASIAGSRRPVAAVDTGDSPLQFYAAIHCASTAAGVTEMLNRLGQTSYARRHQHVNDGHRPCRCTRSGVRMLWTGSVLCCVLAAMRSAGWRSTMPLDGGAAFSSSMRAVALLFLLVIQPRRRRRTVLLVGVSDASRGDNADGVMRYKAVCLRREPRGKLVGELPHEAPGAAAVEHDGGTDTSAAAHDVGHIAHVQVREWPHEFRDAADTRAAQSSTAVPRGFSWRCGAIQRWRTRHHHALGGSTHSPPAPGGRLLSRLGL